MSRCALGCSAKMVSGRSPNSSRAFGSAPEFNAATARAKLFPAAAASSFCVLDRLVPTFSVSNGSDSSIHLVNAPPKATVPSPAAQQQCKHARAGCQLQQVLPKHETKRRLGFN
jgi:hypothetical protein